MFFYAVAAVKCSIKQGRTSDAIQQKEGIALFFLWYFLLYSFAGFLLEITFARVTHHPKKDRKCLMLLPVCPVYGVGALLIHALSGLIRLPIWVMLVGFVGATAAELGMGLFYRYVLHVDFWDYHDQPGNLDGLVCLTFSAYWTVLALVQVYFTDPLVTALILQIPVGLDIPMAVLLSSDLLVSALALRRAETTEVLRWYR